MQFPPNFFTSFTIPTGAGPGTSRIVLTSDGKLISYDNTDTPNTFAALFNGKFFFGPQTVAHEADFPHSGSIGYTLLVFGPFTIPAGQFISPADAGVGGPLSSSMLLMPGDATQLACPIAFFKEPTDTGFCTVLVTGAVAMSPPDQFAPYGKFGANVTAANWFSGPGYTLRYYHDALDNVVWQGEVQYTGANVAAAGGTILTSATVDATYHPTTDRYVPVTHLTSGRVVKNTAAAAIIRADGRFSIIWGDAVGTAHDTNGLATNDIFSIAVAIPLDQFIQG